MILNKCSGNMYADVDFTCNPIRGRCPFNCIYCFGKTGFRKNIKRYQIPFHLHREVMEKGPLPPPGSTIFVGSMTDMWLAPPNFIEWVLKFCNATNNTTEDTIRWVFQSKEPDAMRQYLDLIPINSTLITTIETNIPDTRISKAPPQIYRARQMHILSNTVFMMGAVGIITSVTIEPIMKFHVNAFADIIKHCQSAYVSIGAMTMKEYANHNIEPPTSGDVCDLITELGDVEIRIKKNLLRLVDGKKDKEDFAKWMRDAGCWLTWETEGLNAKSRYARWKIDSLGFDHDKLAEIFDKLEITHDGYIDVMNEKLFPYPGERAGHRIVLAGGNSAGKSTMQEEIRKAYEKKEDDK